MPCTFVQDAEGKTIMILCGPGPYRHLAVVGCPWCCLGEDLTLCAVRLVFGGYGGCDCVCGGCGYEWSSDGDRWNNLDCNQRDDNMAFVASMLQRGVKIGWPTPPDYREEGEDDGSGSGDGAAEADPEVRGHLEGEVPEPHDGGDGPTGQ